MKRPSIKQALILKLSIISIFTIGLSYVSLSTIWTLRSNAEQIGNFWMERLVTAREIKGNFLNLKLVYAQYLLDGTAKDVVWHLIIRMRPFRQVMALNLRFFGAIFAA